MSGDGTRLYSTDCLTAGETPENCTAATVSKSRRGLSIAQPNFASRSWVIQALVAYFSQLGYMPYLAPGNVGDYPGLASYPINSSGVRTPINSAIPVQNTSSGGSTAAAAPPPCGVPGGIYQGTCVCVANGQTTELEQAFQVAGNTLSSEFFTVALNCDGGVDTGTGPMTAPAGGTGYATFSATQGYVSAQNGSSYCNCPVDIQ
jgi:hypothetical protein